MRRAAALWMRWHFVRTARRWKSAFAQIREAREWLRAERELGFGGLADPEAWLAQIEGPGMVLEPAQLLDAASLLDTSGWLRKQFREESGEISAAGGARGGVQRIFAIRWRRFGDACCRAARSATMRRRRCGRIRASIAQTRESIQKTLKQILRSRNAEAGEDYVTLRNDRFVIPVRAENRRSVPGVVHGASGTGQTVFLEPLETVETNNQLVQLAEDEAAEIRANSARV